MIFAREALAGASALWKDGGGGGCCCWLGAPRRRQGELWYFHAQGVLMISKAVIFDCWGGEEGAQLTMFRERVGGGGVKFKYTMRSSSISGSNT